MNTLASDLDNTDVIERPLGLEGPPHELLLYMPVWRQTKPGGIRGLRWVGQTGASLVVVLILLPLVLAVVIGKPGWRQRSLA